ncbi:MAG: hypothetical protein JOZ57_13805, partial [Abitibacteriaceae bacterium]|nr:hypothetical protein [Abditibacteriaceae bacterium]
MAKHETVGSTSWNTIWKRAWGLRVVMGTVLFTALFSLWCGVGSGATNSRPLALSGRLSSGVTHNAGNGNISVQAASKGHRLLLANGFPIPTPGGTPDGTPGGTPGGTPSGTPDGTPSGTPGGTPGPTVTPGPTATPLPTATPGVIPTPTPACSCGASDSSSQLRLYKDDNGELGDEVSAGSTTGGKLWGVLELTVGTCGRVDASPAPTPLPGTNPTPAPTPGDIQNVTVRLTENPDTVNNVTHPFKQNHVDIPISLVNTTGWEKEMPADESHDEPYWVPGNPKDASTDKPHPYRYKFLWQTTAPQILADLSPTPTPGSPAATPAPDDPPAGNTKLYDHNGSHTMSLVAVNGDYTKTHLRFQKMQDDGTWGDPYEAGPSDLGTDVENLVITDVSSNNGTVDYFKWDPASQNQALGNPNISFKIKDLGDPHKYKWIIWFNETSKVHTDTASDWTSSAYKVTGTVDNPQVVTVDLTDANLSGHLDPEVHPSGPYTYDIRVLEYDSNPPTDDAGTGALDKAQFKQPYNEWIPYQFQDGQTSSPGHEVWTAFPDPDTNSNSGDLELRANYYLFPNSSTNNLGANTINMIPMDPALTERTPVPGPTTPGVLHGGDQGLLAYNITSADPDGDWRVIFTGDDASGPISRRTHDFQRIIAINAKGPARSMIPFSTENSNNVVSGNGWYAVWLYAPRVLKKTVYHWQGARTVDSWMNDFVQSNSYSSEWAVMNGGYYDVGAPN